MPLSGDEADAAAYLLIRGYYAAAYLFSHLPLR